MTTQDVAPGLVIDAVDPFDEDGVRSWAAFMTAVVEHEIGDSGAMWTGPEMIAALQGPSTKRKELIYNGYLGGELVAAGWLTLPQLDNLAGADLYLGVRPDHRRRGLGTQVLAHLERVSAEHGRTRFDGLTEWPYDGAPDGSGAPGVEFGKSHGYTLGLGEVQRELPLPADDDLLAALAAEAAPHHSDYELRSWTGAIPDDILLSYLELSATLATEAPTGDLEREDHAVDVDAHRSSEAVMAEQQRTPWHTVALDKDGRVVAYTDLIVGATDPRWVHQWGTLVGREHRGHRLGLAVKVANLRALQAGAPEVAGRRVITWNAEVNEHMIGVNERMGFRATARGGQLQKKV